MTILDYLNKVQKKELKESLVAMHEEFYPLMKSMPAAIRHHHAEPGGFYRHTLEVIEISLRTYASMKMDFVKRFVFEDDVILVGFIHDLEKLNKYKKNGYYEAEKKWEHGYRETEFLFNFDKTDMDDTAEVVRYCADYGIRLEDKHLNAVSYAHGGWSLNPRGKLLPLAALLHSADLFSTVMYKKS